MIEKKHETVRARIRPSLKRETQEIFDEMGLTTSQAIVLFLEQVRLRRGLPFPVEIPTAETRVAMREAMTPEKLERFETVDEAFDSLEW